MGDSDEEGDRRRREKFQRERPDRPDNHNRDRRRDNNWEDRRRSDGGNNNNNWNNRRGRDNNGFNDNRRRERYSNSPPQKRMRRDWDDRGGFGGEMGGGFPSPGPFGPSGWGPSPDLRNVLGPQQHFPPGPPMNRVGGPELDHPTQPPMIPFKQFLANQDDTINEEEAVKRYNMYKLDFRKTQINEFFLAHKDEEWFKVKYHPEESAKRRNEIQLNLKSRLDAFLKLHRSGRVYTTPLETENSAAIIKMLDAAVILMEGGTEEDILVLDHIKEEEDDEEPPAVKPAVGVSMVVGEVAHKKETALGPKSPTPEKKKKKKRQKKRGDYNDSESGSDSGSESESGSSSSSSSSSSSGSESELEEGEEKKEKKPKVKAAAEIKEKQMTETPEKSIKPVESVGKALHRTQSIFIRNLAPNITKQEVEALCKKYPGYMRVALQDPQAERKFFRRGWVTFDRNVNIKDICWNLSNIRLRDCELGAIVNRDLKQRVRPVSGLVNHKQAIRMYIKLAAKVIQNLDDRWRVWDSDDEKSDLEKEAGEEVSVSFGLQSKNPVLKGITDYLVDEVNLEDELLGEMDEKKDANAELTVEKDLKMIRVLDGLVWYLRIVHSIDFYNGIEYPNEHEMPHRCGIIHARGNIPDKLPTQAEMNDFIGHFEQKVKQFTDEKRPMTETESVQLGRKDPELEVEKFITANTQELAKDKWLCPLSGKKFKGPEFVRKHVLTKHAEKVDEVKVEAMYFNNYLDDSKRPALPEHPSNCSKPGGMNRRSMGDMGPPQPGGFHHGGPMGPPPFPRGPAFGFGDPYGGGGGPGGFSRMNPYNNRDIRRGPPRYGNSGGRRDGRSLIKYTDLDAPEDADIF